MRAGRRLRLGISLTFLTVLLVAVAASTGWWPEEGSSKTGAPVEVSTASGTWCGTLRASGGGVLGLEVADAGQQYVDIPLGEVAALRPVGTCDA